DWSSDVCSSDLRPAVLDVALAVLRDLPRDAHRCAAVGHAVAELLVGTRLVESGKTLLDPEAVIGDMEIVSSAQRLGRGDARVVVLAHLVRREVRVRARAVPVTAHRLRVERRADAEILPHPVEEPPCDPQLIADLGR